MEVRKDIRWFIWLDEEERIASFHPVDGYCKRIFDNRDTFDHFLTSLAFNGYRFQ